MHGLLKANFITGLLILLFASSVIPVLAQETELEQFARQSRSNVAEFKSIINQARRIEIETIGVSATSEVCRITAPQLYHEFSVKKHILLHRVSLTPRNSITGHADAWEQAGLLKIKSMFNNGGDGNDIEVFELVQEPAGKYYRYLSPIIAEKGCLKCHGTEKDIGTETANVIKHHYPDDRATGFKVGDLIGAISIKKEYAQQ